MIKNLITVIVFVVGLLKIIHDFNTQDIGWSIVGTTAWIAIFVILMRSYKR